ncbi:unnamed protein product [Medioppia subpectinata]|uniref:Uridine 5'-monophosphate synthase n=1 Tax=Medioppia subpectinata TaxID=1979941 RepID=A0A7R9L0A4_9ACAR|nr:unnamed protein product [Medioppia subpectinata]CAG2112974.1 unnamed protein product [Medioppia subpectinata]
MSSAMIDPTLRQLIADCHHFEAIKFGDFVLKTGIHSPIYLDIRPMVNRPKPLKQLSELMYKKIISMNITHDLICGVPYSALSIASSICVQKFVNMITKRKENKDYGTKQLIEGQYKPGDHVVIVEDIISSGSSILETVIALRSAGLVVTDAIVFIDRQQNGVNNMKEYGIDVHSLIDVKTALDVLEEEKRINGHQKSGIIEWIDANPLRINDDIVNEWKLLCLQNKTSKLLSYEERSQLPETHPLSQQLFKLMVRKKSNLCVAVDLTTSKEILDLAEKIGPSIVMLKLHIDIVEDFDHKFIEELTALAAEHEFFIFEDRKFADIGQTVGLQFTKGVHRISSWAHIVNAHLVSGPGVLEGLRQGFEKDSNRGCLLVASMSTKDNLMNSAFPKSAYKWSQKYKDFVIGFICQSRVSADQRFIHMTPGVHIDVSGDPLGQQYVTPEEAIKKRGADVVIVGRGITGASDREFDHTLQLYQKRAFEAYLNRDSD